MKAEFIDHMGSDLTVCNAARVSFNKEAEFHPSGSLYEQDEKLISYLARHNHFTPFTHPQITMRETVPIFVARQRLKHVVGFSYNEVSRRYVDNAPEFFYPEIWRSRPEGGLKQGSGGPIQHNNAAGDIHARIVARAELAYEELLGMGVAPEQARMVLPQSMMTSYYVTGSLAAWARAYKLRIDSHAQVEIQMLAKQWSEIIQPLFPISWQALVK